MIVRVRVSEKNPDYIFVRSQDGSFSRQFKKDPNSSMSTGLLNLLVDKKTIYLNSIHGSDGVVELLPNEILPDQGW